MEKDNFKKRKAKIMMDQLITLTHESTEDLKNLADKIIDQYGDKFDTSNISFEPASLELIPHSTKHARKACLKILCSSLISGEILISCKLPGINMDLKTV
jgi:hypothetical protein